MSITTAPDPRLTESRYRGPLVAISAGIGMHGFHDLAIAASIPIAFDALGRLDLLPLSYALFFAGLVAGGVLSAHLRARFGARATGLCAAVVFLAGVALTAAAPTAPVFALGRALQGLSDGVVAALCYSLVPELFPAALVARVFSVEAVVWAVAAALGPLAAGYATETLGWRAAMCVSLPLAAIFLLAGARVLPRRASDRLSATPRALPGGALALCFAGIVLLSLPTALPGLHAAAAGVPAGLALVALALRLDARRAVRFFPRDLFRRGTVGRVCWVMLLMPIAHSASIVFLALCLREIWDLSPVWIGWIVVTTALSWSGSAILVAYLPVPGRRALLPFAPALQIAGALMIAAGLSTGLLPLVILGQVASGCAFGTSWGAANEIIIAETAAAEQSRTAAFMPTIQTTGFAVGTALFGWLAAAAGLVPALEAGAAAGPVWVLWGGAAAVATATLVIAQRLRS